MLQEIQESYNFKLDVVFVFLFSENNQRKFFETNNTVRVTEIRK